MGLRGVSNPFILKKNTMSNIGWIKIHRKIIDWEWYTDINVCRLFTHLLLIANFEPKKWRGIDLKKGSVLTGLNKLSNETGLSVQQVRTALNKLLSTSEVTNETSTQGTIIQIINFDKYNGATSELIGEQQATNKRATNEQQTSNNYKERKERKEKKEDIPDFTIFLAYAKEHKPKVDALDLKLKYEAWKVNDWKDGNNKPIKNWKTKVLNTLPHIKEIKVDEGLSYAERNPGMLPN